VLKERDDVIPVVDDAQSALIVLRIVVLVETQKNAPRERGIE
jgi:hypothetical protein